jgi:hypothetical protein
MTPPVAPPFDEALDEHAVTDIAPIARTLVKIPSER